MQVFKAYFKVIRGNLHQMLIYLGVFMALSMLFVHFGGSDTGNTGFIADKRSIAIFNEDGNTPLTNGFNQYMAQNAKIVKLDDNKQSIQDALFFRKVEYIIRIPKGFSQSFMSGGSVTLDKTDLPASASAQYTDFLVQRYFNTVSLYINALPGLSGAELVSNVSKDLAQQADITVQYYAKNTGNSTQSGYFNYVAYSIMAILVLGITSIMLVFNDVDLRRRNVGSPIRTISMNMQLVLGNLVFAVIVWAVMMVASLIFCGGSLTDAHTLLFMLNAFVMTLVCLSIAFLSGNFIKSRGAQSAIANVLALGLGFISGIFVPQYLLNGTIKTISSFQPLFWYVKANNDISDLSVYSLSNMQPILIGMLIQMGFAVAIMLLSLIVSKQKRQSVV